MQFTLLDDIILKLHYEMIIIYIVLLEDGSGVS